MPIVNEQQLMSLDQQITQLSSALEHLRAARSALAGNTQQLPRPIETAAPVTISSNRGRRRFSPSKPTPQVSGRRSGISAAGRKRIAQAMKRRWAERRAQKNAENPQVQELVHAASS